MSSTASLLLPPVNTPKAPAISQMNSAKTSRQSVDVLEKQEKSAEKKTSQLKDPIAGFESFMASFMPNTKLGQSAPILFQASSETGFGSATAPHFGRAYNSDPALVVLPSAEMSPQQFFNTGASFSEALTDALTPGTPKLAAAPAETIVPTTHSATIKSAELAVSANAVSTTTASTATTPPALVATGLDIPAMENMANVAEGKADATKPHQQQIVTLVMKPDQTSQAAQLAQVKNMSESPALASALLQAQEETAALKQMPATKSALATDIWGENQTGFEREAGIATRPTAGTQAAKTVKAAASGVETSAANSTDTKPKMVTGATSGTVFGTNNTTLDFADLASSGTIAGLGASTSLNGALSAPGILHQAVATATHPATATVAAAMQSAASGNAKSLSVELTPPELGRVMIDMKMDHAKRMKITFTVEKDSTMHLLQRDTQFLQSTLEKAGLDKNTEISFELASDQEGFQQQASDRETFFENDRLSWRITDDNGLNAETIDAATTYEPTNMDWHWDQKLGSWRVDTLI